MERSYSINIPRLLALLEKVMALLPMITWSTSRVFERGLFKICNLFFDFHHTNKINPIL